MKRTDIPLGNQDTPRPFRVGEWYVDPSAYEIWHQDETVKLQPKVMDLLVYFSVNTQRPVSRQELIDSVWGGTVISDDAVTNAIVKLRRALGEAHGATRYIQTIPKAGYRMIAPITSVATRPEGAVVGAQDFGWNSSTSREPHKRWSRWGPLSAVAAAIAAALLLATQYDVMAPTRTSATYIQVSDLPGREAMPAASPDGTRLAIVWSSEQAKNFEESDIYVMSLDTGRLMQLTNSPERDTNPVWSPDGESIAFVRFSGMQCGIYLIGAQANGVEKFLHPCGASPMRQVYSTIDWSLDGQWIAYVGSGDDNLLFHIALYSLATGEVRQITQPTGDVVGDLSPVISPLNDKVAFTRMMPSGSNEIFVVDVDGGEPRQLTNGRSRLQGLSWSRDGQSVFYLAGRRDSAELWQVELRERKSQRIPGTAKGLFDLRRAYDGSFYASMLRTDKVEAKLLHLDGGAGTEPTTIDIHSSDVSRPIISPDGQKIAYVAKRRGLYELRIADMASQGSVSLFQIGEYPLFFSFNWSPGSDKLTISQGEDGNTSVYLVDVASGKSDKLFSGRFTDYTPILSRNGEYLIYSSRRSGNWQLRKFSLLDNSDSLLVRGGGFNPQESSDGKWIYYYRYDNPGGIWRTSLQGDATTLVLQEPYPIKQWFHWYNWDLGNGGIHIATPNEAGAELSFFDFDTGQLTAVGNLPVKRTRNISISTNHSYLAYTPSPHTESDIIRLNLTQEVKIGPFDLLD